MTFAKIPFICLVSLLLPSMASAENFLAVLGGGGEPAGNKTIFDNGVKRLSENLKLSKKWNYDVAFNGGHPETENMLRRNFAQASSHSNFTPTNYRELIASYKAKILLGDIKKGDQILLIISTHGAINDGSQDTHKIAATGKAASDLNKLSDADLVSLDELASLVKLTNDNGISMGIVDLSCHSGSTLKLKSPNTCVVTATGPNHYGFAGGGAFTDKFLDHLKPGKTLEQAFLQARLESDDASYPMISTDEHESIAREVYRNITPYLYYYDPKADKMSGYLQETSNDLLMCLRENQFKNLISKIEEFQKLVPESQYAENLKRLLKQYKTTQDNILSRMQNLGGQFLEQKENFITPVPGSSRPVTNPLTWKKILDEDPDKWIAHFSASALKEKNPKEKAYLLAVAENYRKIKAKKEFILKSYPHIRDYEKEAKNLVQQMGENRKVAEQIAVEEKKYYDNLYQKRQGLNFKDPCRKIVF